MHTFTKLTQDHALSLPPSVFVCLSVNILCVTCVSELEKTRFCVWTMKASLCLYDAATAFEPRWLQGAAVSLFGIYRPGDSDAAELGR